MTKQNGFGMGALQPLEQSGVRVLTTSQLAAAYGADKQLIVNNFNRNKDRYQLEKHFIVLEGNVKNDFIDQNQIDLGSRNSKTLYLWTEKGAWLHAKSLNTDQAWDAYEMLVDDYYEKIKLPTSPTEIAMLTLSSLKEQTDRLDTVEERLDEFIDKAPILPQQAGELTVLVKKKVYATVNANFAGNANVAGKLFGKIGGDIKKAFGVNRRDMIAKKDYERAVAFVRAWEPDSVTRYQLQLDLADQNSANRDLH